MAGDSGSSGSEDSVQIGIWAIGLIAVVATGLCLAIVFVRRNHQQVVVEGLYLDQLGTEIAGMGDDYDGYMDPARSSIAASPIPVLDRHSPDDSVSAAAEIRGSGGLDPSFNTQLHFYPESSMFALDSLVMFGSSAPAPDELE